MNEHRHEPLSDDQLSALLRKWIVETPPDLDSRVFSAMKKPRRAWWRVLVSGYVRVPVPVVCCVALLLIGLAWESARVAVTCSTAASAFPNAARTATAVKPVPRSGHFACPANSNC